MMGIVLLDVHVSVFVIVRFSCVSLKRRFMWELSLTVCMVSTQVLLVWFMQGWWVCKYYLVAASCKALSLVFMNEMWKITITCRTIMYCTNKFCELTHGTRIVGGIFMDKCMYLLLTLKVLVTTVDAQWEGMGDVGLARYELALLPPCPTIRVLSYSN